INVLILGRKRSWEEKYCLNNKLLFKGIPTRKRAGKLSLQNLPVMLKLGVGFFETLKILREFSPEIVVGTGGYVSVPVMTAGFFGRYPMLIHEQNIVPGLTTRVFAPLAKEITVTFEKTAGYFSKRIKKKIFVTGCPLGKAAKSDRDKRLTQEAFGLEDNKFTLLVMGGSQGARRLNQLVLAAQKIWQKIHLPIQIIHLTGEKDYPAVRDAYIARGINVFISPFHANMGEIYNMSHLAVARAGAVSLAELAAWGIPAIIVPYPYAAGRHQDLNAQFFARKGAAKVFREEDLTPQILSREVSLLVNDKERRQEMAEASRSLGRKDATEILSRRIIRLAKSSRR
ncbi:MAG: undecaprenyldiphospho-muramoylpentapeptide beta-N-acetylglucosaminyltransferase, partial [Candidatus Ratteibacteria bacterium]|nr:undecaprenyldiphospho-muramoylpentapeptide beta-N-acetylglucosaminyltransferase [Candidatus Ratteibacteria bacterium]